MKEKISIKIPRQSIIYFCVCLIGILIFVFAGILPYRQSLAKFDEKIAKIQSDIAVQEELYPVYLSLIKKTQQKSASSLPMPAKSFLPKSQIDRIPSTVRQVAARSGMNLTAVSPDLNALSGSAQEIPVRIVVRGNFLKFRNFLLGLGYIPFVDRVEEIQIQQNPDALEFRTKIFLTLG